ncbi:unnamed protein product, partial [Arabidopsis halleri]
MAAQTMKKICSFLMIVFLFTLTVSTYASTVEVCVKHCVPNQCMKVSQKRQLFLYVRVLAQNSATKTNFLMTNTSRLEVITRDYSGFYVI